MFEFDGEKKHLQFRHPPFWRVTFNLYPPTPIFTRIWRQWRNRVRKSGRAQRKFGPFVLKVDLF